MNEQNEHATGSPDELAERLRSELRTMESSAADAEVESIEPSIEELLSVPGVETSALVTSAADSLIESASVSPQLKARMIEAARRRLAERKRAHGLLPTLLRSARIDAGLSVEDVAATSGLEVTAVVAFERGDTQVTRLLPENEVADWAKAVPVDHSLVRAALRRSLTVDEQGHTLAAGPESTSKNADAYVEAVMRRLQDAAEEQGKL